MRHHAGHIMPHASPRYNAQMTPDDQWITKQEAGLRLGLSGRRIHDLANAGRLQSTQVRDPETGHMAIRIHAGSVERYLFDRGNPTNSPPEPHQNPTKELRISRGANDLVDQIIMRMVHAAQSAPSARLWLTVTESAAYSGLPVTVISELIRQDRLKAMDVGRRRGGRWRIRRMDLEGFSG